ncbi:DUF427 domain-containing protein [Shimia biformata]|uniref:DUF427 domain-containing protein n=1 Tax=Shimia biformata TaxID=1294299 RepID=UPI0019521831|nr:DUF427 domain-containing protein [Shimia biformata]
MSIHTDISADYGIEIKPLDGPVRVMRGEVVLAETTRAKVVYETRLPPQVYVPAEDVKIETGGFTDLKTFCPFKGTARYHDITLGGVVFPNAIWTYARPLPESAAIDGYVGFMPGVADRIDTGGIDLGGPRGGNISGPLVDWLLREAWLCRTPEDFAKALGEKMVDHGIAVSRLSLMIWSLHPLIAGRNYIWRRGADEIETFAPSYELYEHPSFLNSPLRHVSKGLGGVRQIIGPGGDDAFPVITDLRAEGATDYVAMPLPFTDGRTNVLTLASDHPDGFTTANLGMVFECAPVISRYLETFTQRENAQSLLETYVGKRSGARVLGGEIRRGDGDEIDAAIMFCDLRGSTALSEAMPQADYLELLNRFFETTAKMVEQYQGEVLKFIGDAVLAVFPAEKNPETARRNAVDAAREIVRAFEIQTREEEADPISCAIGIAYGRVTYGNVGSRDRLDFTVIGAPANIAARLGDLGKREGQAIVVSSDFAGEGYEVRELGKVKLHNVAEPVLCHVVPVGAP